MNLLGSNRRHQAILAAVESLKSGAFKATAVKIELEMDLDRSISEEEFLDGLLSRYARKTNQTQRGYIDTDEDAAEIYNPFPEIAYIRCYNDGSVDTEVTATFKLDIPGNVFTLPVFIDAWNETCADEGEGDVSGAGMHMALLNTPDCSYPSHRITDANMRRFRKFKKSMTLLLPALYFLGTHNSQSRSLEYRRPMVDCSEQSHGFDKFNAVNYGHGAVEFRIFDTCYDKPEAVLDNLVVMRNAMRYWRLQYLSPGLESIATRCDFGNDYSYDLERFYSSTTHIDLLNQGLIRLKPTYLTIAQLKDERQFKLSKSSFNRKERELKEQAAIEYEEYSERFDWSLQARRYEFIAREISGASGDSTQRNPGVLERSERLAEEYVQSLARDKISLIGFIQEKIKSYMESNNGRYTLSIDD